MMQGTARFEALLLAAALLLPGLSAFAQSAVQVGDPAGRHHSSATQITTANVASLRPAWVFRTGDAAREPAERMQRSSGQATPLLLPDTAGAHLVVCTPFSRVIALDPARGTVRWEFDPKVVRGGSRGYRCRGVAYGAVEKAGEACRHRIYVATHDRRLIALDARSGEPCADFGQGGTVLLPGHGTGRVGDVTSSSPPAVAKGIVVVGSSIVDFEFAEAPRGTVVAVDAATGALRWQFDPLAGAAGTGGANVWAPMSIDAERDLIFLPTSSPSPDYYGVGRPGDSGFANSVVALRLSTGNVVWSFATSHHDLWDFDVPAQPVLFDWPGPQGPVPALAQPTKQGFVFVLDRVSGRPLFEVRQRPVPASTIAGEVTAPTQPFPVRPPALVDPNLRPEDAWGLSFWDRGKCRDQLAAMNHQGLFTPPSEQRTVMFPGSLGGANWGGGALLPARQLLIVNVNAVPFYGQLLKAGELAGASDHISAGSAFVTIMKGTPYAMKIDAIKSPLGLPCSAPPWGKLVAVDLAQGTLRWQVPLGSIHDMGPVRLPFRVNWGTPNLGGGLVTDGGVFFIGATMDRLFRAFDAVDGRELWSYELPADATATPASYVHQGRQYVVINAGGHNMFNRGSSDHFYAFALP